MFRVVLTNTTVKRKAIGDIQTLVMFVKSNFNKPKGGLTLKGLNFLPRMTYGRV